MTEYTDPTPEIKSTSQLDVYLERHGHLKGARVIGELADSFGVVLSDKERRAIAIKVAVDRGIESAVYGSSDYGLVHNAIIKGNPYGDGLPPVLAIEFQNLLTQLPFEEAASMRQLPAAYDRLKVSDENLSNSSRRSVDYLFTLRNDALHALAQKRAKFMSVAISEPHEAESEAATHERRARKRFNTWMKEFYYAYEQLGSARKSRTLLPEIFQQDGRLGEWRSLERKELIRTLRSLCITSEPETVATLAWRGMGRVRERVLRLPK